MMSSPETRENRLKICNDCEFSKLGFCTKCGCVLQIKVSFQVQSCPINKWSAE